MRRLLADGIDPSAQRKDDRRKSLLSAVNTFEAVAREWFAKESGRWTAHHLADVRAFAGTGSLSSHQARYQSQIMDASTVLGCIKAIEKRGALEVAHRTAQRISSVCRYAVLTGRAKYNPAADLRGAIKTRKVEHMKAMPRDELPEFLRKLDKYNGRPETRIGLKLLALTFVRTGELRRARWQEIDFDKEAWRIPAERMKMREEHIVPLAPQAIAALRELHAITGQTPLLFPWPVERVQAGIGKHVPVRAIPDGLSRSRDWATDSGRSRRRRSTNGMESGRDRAPARARRAE